MGSIAANGLPSSVRLHFIRPTNNGYQASGIKTKHSDERKSLAGANRCHLARRLSWATEPTERAAKSGPLPALFHRHQLGQTCGRPHWSLVPLCEPPRGSFGRTEAGAPASSLNSRMDANILSCNMILSLWQLVLKREFQRSSRREHIVQTSATGHIPSDCADLERWFGCESSLRSRLRFESI